MHTLKSQHAYPQSCSSHTHMQCLIIKLNNHIILSFCETRICSVRIIDNLRNKIGSLKKQNKQRKKGRSAGLVRSVTASLIWIQTNKIFETTNCKKYKLGAIFLY